LDTPIDARPRVAWRLQALAIAPLTLLFALLVVRFGLFLASAAWAIGYPNELDYGEGIVWEQMRWIVSGHGYGPIDVFPAIVFHYPPVYHVLTSLLSGATGLDGLTAGRLVSSISTLGAAAFAGGVTAQLVSGRTRTIQWTCGLATALVALSCYPVARWAPLMRVDMVATMLTLGGLCLSLAAVRRPRLIYLAAVLFVSAVYAKQTMIAAPAAAFGTLLVFRPRVALAGLLTSVGLGLVGLAWLEVSTGGGFIRHTLLYNINRFEWEQLAQIWRQAQDHLAFVLFAAFGAYLCWKGLSPALGGGRNGLRRRLAEDPSAIRALIALSYLLLASAMLILVAKSGATINYLIEWFLVVSIFGGVGLRPAAEFAFGGAKIPDLKFAVTFLVLLALALQTSRLPLPPRDLSRTPAEQAEVPALLAMVRAADKPVISDDMVVVIKGGKRVVWESAIFAELGSTGVYDQRPFIQMIHRKAFAFFVTRHDRGNWLFDARYNPEVAQALDESYPRKRELAGFVVHLPAE